MEYLGLLNHVKPSNHGLMHLDPSNKQKTFLQYQLLITNQAKYVPSIFEVSLVLVQPPGQLLNFWTQTATPMISTCTVQSRLSRPCLSGPSIIRTSWRPESTTPHMHRRRGQWSFVGVVTSWAMSYGLCRLALGKAGLLDYFLNTAGHDRTSFIS